MKDILFSIIVPVYNSAEYIADTIQSVWVQTYTRWELLMIDDGSSDHSLEVLKEWAKKDKRIRILQHPGGVNKGVSATRNVGIKHANGQWVAFLDADDIWYPKKLEIQHDIIVKNQELVFIYALADVIDENSQKIVSKNQAYAFNSKYSVYGAGIPGLMRHPFKYAVSKAFEAPTSSVVAKANIIQQIGGFEEDMSYSEDGLLWYRILERGDLFFYGKPLLAYRVHSSQWNAKTKDSLKLTRRFYVYHKLINMVAPIHQKLISYLFVNKGFRIVVRSFIGYPYFNPNMIINYFMVLWKNKRVVYYHKIYSIWILLSEMLILPLRLIKKLFS